MRIVDLPNPAPGNDTWVTNLEPWQREGLLRLREVLGVDADALLRAGVTVVLSIICASTDAATPSALATEGAPDPNPARSEITLNLPPGDLSTEEPGSGDAP
jgi:hypothetical protein